MVTFSRYGVCTALRSRLAVLMICLAASPLPACSSNADDVESNIASNSGSLPEEQTKIKDEAAEEARQATAEDLKEGSAAVNAGASASEDPADANEDAATND